MPERVLRAMRESDLPAADPILRAAFGVERDFTPRLRRYMAIQPDGWFVGEQRGTLLGTVGVVRYPGFAYIGLMAVAPSAQGRGLGRWLLEHALGWLEDRGGGCAVLDATEAGAPLYEKLGFVDAGATVEMARVRREDREDDGTPRRAAAESALALVRVGVDAADAADLRDLDGRLFGAPRPAVWTRLAAEVDPVVPTWLAREAGRAVGYVALQPGLLGPWAASEPHVAEALLAHALAQVPGDAPLRVQVPATNVAAVALLERWGFGVQRRLRHMRRGDLTRAPAWREVYGKGSYCLG
jgi:ribosomal protein S18 acetylase RimI-like enzyme